MIENFAEQVRSKDFFAHQDIKEFDDATREFQTARGVLFYLLED